MNSQIFFTSFVRRLAHISTGFTAPGIAGSGPARCARMSSKPHR